MRIHGTAYVAISLVVAAGCAGELAQRPAATDPTQIASAEAAFTPPAPYATDPLLTATPLPSAEPAPTGTEQLHSPTSTPTDHPPVPSGPAPPAPAAPRPEAGRHDHRPSPGSDERPRGAVPKPPAAQIYVCPMHPEVRSIDAGKCPICGMTLTPREAKP